MVIAEFGQWLEHDTQDRATAPGPRHGYWTAAGFTGRDTSDNGDVVRARIDEDPYGGVDGVLIAGTESGQSSHVRLTWECWHELVSEIERQRARRRTYWNEPAATTAELADRYADHIINTGGNPISELLDGRTEVFINAPRALLEHGVQAQAALLASLRKAGLLLPPPEPSPDHDDTAGDDTEEVDT